MNEPMSYEEYKEIVLFDREPADEDEYLDVLESDNDDNDDDGFPVCNCCDEELRYDAEDHVWYCWYCPADC